MQIKNLAHSLADELILADVLGTTREFLIAHPEARINAAQLKKYAAMRRRLNRGEPLAYVLGYRWFMSNKFRVAAGVLIPRPETEQAVELATKLAQKIRARTILDIGTGSGAIIVSLRRIIKKSRAEFIATDISAKALKMARTNAKTILKSKKPPIAFKRGSLLAPVAGLLKKRGAQPTLIIANLPYLSINELREPSIRFEPRLALYGGADRGLAKINALLHQIAALKLQHFAIILEINYNQATAVRKNAHRLFPVARFTVHKDLSGFDRLVEITA